MSILRALAIHVLSLGLLFCCLNYVSSSFFWTTTPPTTTTPTLRPFTRTPGLSLPVRYSHPPKCYREVPAVFFKYEKDVEIIGNSTTNPYFNLIEVCCKGYKRYDFDWSKCVPDCGNKCVHNGWCIEGYETGVCQCFDEFVLNHRNECVPTCPLGCQNGKCYLNGTCICDYGYELDGTKKFCVPQCVLGCGHNQYCSEPNVCECEEGYVSAIPDLGWGCQPVCIPDCGHGQCVGPNQCECFHGYQKRLNGTVCESNCYMRCENGFCANQTTCVCQNGYKYDINSTSCLPDCGDDCENGVCISPGICRCYHGYIRDGPKCVAVCQRPCSYYGRCVAPNVCGCAIVDGPTNSFQHCEMGFCDGRGRCRCEDGYTRFINKCMSPDKVTTYASMYPHALNRTFANEFNLLIGQYFMFLPKTELSRMYDYAGYGVPF